MSEDIAKIAAGLTKAQRVAVITPHQSSKRRTTMQTIGERFESNRCSGWQAGRCVHGFPGTRFCIGSLDPMKVFEAAKPQCCDENWQ